LANDTLLPYLKYCIVNNIRSPTTVATLVASNRIDNSIKFIILWFFKSEFPKIQTRSSGPPKPSNLDQYFANRRLVFKLTREMTKSEDDYKSAATDDAEKNLSKKSDEDKLAAAGTSNNSEFSNQPNSRKQVTISTKNVD